MAKDSTDCATPQGDDHTYPQCGGNATPALLEKVQGKIEKNGPMPFSEFMALALYDPDHGYYSGTTQRVGKEADFITSVSVGRCFGLILARRLHAYWQSIGKPGSFHIIEPAAHDGALCLDILSEIKVFSPEFFHAIHYHLVEISDALREKQLAKLSGTFPKKISHHAGMDDVKNLHGAIIANELIDAMPVELVRFENSHWVKLMVSLDDERALCFSPADLDDPEMANFFHSLGNNYPEGYTTEYNIGANHFLKQAHQALTRGVMIVIDYGHLSEDYYHPDRTAGTLQTFCNHKKADNPLQSPGELDITAHVDFSRFASQAESLGFTPSPLITQASYLTRHAREWLISLETSHTPEMPALLRQFQTLTHPSMLGSKFQVLEMEKHA